jgi:hypothetical protein
MLKSKTLPASKPAKASATISAKAARLASTASVDPIPAKIARLASDSSTIPQRTTTVVPGLSNTLGCGATLAWRLVRNGQVKSLRLGRRVLVTIDSIDELIEREANRPQPPKRLGPQRGRNPRVTVA